MKKTLLLILALIAAAATTQAASTVCFTLSNGEICMNTTLITGTKINASDVLNLPSGSGSENTSISGFLGYENTTHNIFNITRSDGKVFNVNITDNTGASVSDGVGIYRVSGDQYVNVQNGTWTNITLNTTAVQLRVNFTCSSGSSIRSINQSGTGGACETDSTGDTDTNFYLNAVTSNYNGSLLQHNYSVSGAANVQNNVTINVTGSLTDTNESAAVFDLYRWVYNLSQENDTDTYYYNVNDTLLSNVTRITDLLYALSANENNTDTGGGYDNTSILNNLTTLGDYAYSAADNNTLTANVTTLWSWVAALSANENDTDTYYYNVNDTLLSNVTRITDLLYSLSANENNTDTYYYNVNDTLLSNVTRITDLLYSLSANENDTNTVDNSGTNDQDLNKTGTPTFNLGVNLTATNGSVYGIRVNNSGIILG